MQLNQMSVTDEAFDDGGHDAQGGIENDRFVLLEVMAWEELFFAKYLLAAS